MENNSDSVEYGRTVKFYRNNVGFCAQAVSTRASIPTHTLNIEMAPKLSGAKCVDWKKKTVLQISPLELPRFTALLLGWIITMEGKFHGHNNNKGYECKHQGDNVYIHLSSGGKWSNINLSLEEVFLLSQLAIAQLQKSMTDSTVGDVMNLLRLTIGRHKAPS